MADLHQQLLAELDPSAPWDDMRDERAYRALRAVVELHAPVLLLDLPTCPACAPIVVDLVDDAGVWTEHPRPAPAPCSTVQAIARELGVQEDNHGQG